MVGIKKEMVMQWKGWRGKVEIVLDVKRKELVTGGAFIGLG